MIWTDISESDEDVDIQGSVAWNESKRFDSIPFVNVTDFLKESTSKMHPGQVLSVSSFNLWDAVAAIEIMDPRTDAGLPVETTETKVDVVNVDQVIVSAAQIIGIIDELMSYEMAWIAGFSLAQTLFTCVLMHAPHDIQSPTLKALILTYSKTVTALTSILDASAYFEDDEFDSRHKVFKTAPEVSNEEVIGNLQEVEDDLIINYRMCKGTNSDNTVPLETFEWAVDEEPLELLNALLARALLSALANFSKRNIPAFKKNVSNAITQLQLCKKSAHMGTPFSALFNPHLNRRQYTGTPPQKPPVTNSQKAFEEMGVMLIQIEKCFNVQQLGGLTDVMSRVQYFSAQKPYPNILVRTIFMFYSPPYFSSTNKSIQQKMTEFLDMAEECVSNFLKVFAYNRALERRNLIKVVLIWESLQGQAEVIDTEIQTLLDPSLKESDPQPYYISSWVYHYKLEMIESYIRQGFELDLFAAYEHPMMLWYLDHVYAMMSYHWTRLKGFVNEEKKLVRGKMAEWKVRDLFRASKQGLTRGLHVMTLLLQRMGVIKTPDPEFYWEEIQFNQRFRKLALLASPLLPSYQEMKKTESNLLIRDEKFYALAMLQTSKAFWEESNSNFDHLESVKPHPFLSVEREIESLKRTVALNLQTVNRLLKKWEICKIARRAFTVSAGFGHLKGVENWEGGRLFRWKVGGFSVVGVQ
ncbi:N-alpha-acetyltransferase 35 NatC auxiliary subunit [Chytridiales sp. JEL 0842]|nr:N-alpha-acetyltransferase 35 NatC auxiliary subunit [Chytridiales sp. JEL 0842]